VLPGCGTDAAPPPVAVEEVPASPAASRQDDRIYQFSDLTAAEREREVDARMTSMAELGAAVVRVDFRWDLIAPTRPADPADPDDAAYDWARYDPIVAAATRHGVELLFTVWGTPTWAADPTVAPNPGQAYAVRPARAEDYGAFAAAAASRYAPRGVRRWEAWNEPNIQFFLTPQYARRDGRWVAVSPATYSDLLTQFYDNVKRVAPDVEVAGAVMAPTGDECDLSGQWLFRRHGSSPGDGINKRPFIYLALKLNRHLLICQA
jgi:hypothetical protein